MIIKVAGSWCLEFVFTSFHQRLTGLEGVYRVAKKIKKKTNSPGQVNHVKLQIISIKRHEA